MTLVVTPRHPNAHKVVATFEQLHNCPITSASVTDDGSILITGAMDGSAALWTMFKHSHDRNMRLRCRLVVREGGEQAEG